jgi:hypothetical protein
VVTSKPAIRGRVKTGQQNSSGTELFFPTFLPFALQATAVRTASPDRSGGKGVRGGRVSEGGKGVRYHFPCVTMKNPLIRPRPSATFSPSEKVGMIFPLRGERVAAMRRRVRGFSTLRFPEGTLASGGGRKGYLVPFLLTPFLLVAFLSCREMTQAYR